MNSILKITIMTMVIATICYGALLGKAAAKEDAEPPKNAIVIEVKGLSCPFCVLGIEKRLKAIEAVKEVASNWSKGEVYVLVKDGQSVSDAELRDAVKRAGFTPGKIKRPEGQNSQE